MSLTGTIVDRLRSLAPASDGTDGDAVTDVAVACQGGGSHAAFTAGALGHLLENIPPDYRLRGLSGTSGGAVCAATAWYGLLADRADPAALLEGVWMDLAATSSWEQWVNALAVSKVERGKTGIVGGSPNPYRNPGSDWGRRQIESVLGDHVDFDAVPSLLADADGAPRLYVAAVAVETGEARTFVDDEVDADAVLASAAVPTMFEAVEVDGENYWDGVFARNPPIREFVTDDAVGPVDEVWVIQLTPSEVAATPTSDDAIDRRIRQLVGNLSLRQELAFVEAVDEWATDGRLADATGTTVRTISLHDEQARNSKLDRDESFVRDLVADGRAEAVGFLNELPPGDA